MMRQTSWIICPFCSGHFRITVDDVGRAEHTSQPFCDVFDRLTGLQFAVEARSALHLRDGKCEFDDIDFSNAEEGDVDVVLEDGDEDVAAAEVAVNFALRPKKTSGDVN